MVEIGVYCGPPQTFGHPKILQWPILGTQFLNPGYDPDHQTFLVYMTSVHMAPFDNKGSQTENGQQLYNYLAFSEIIIMIFCIFFPVIPG